MRGRKRLLRLASAFAAVALIAAACGGDDDDVSADGGDTTTDGDTTDGDTTTDGDDGGMSLDDVEMGTGVTADPCPEAVNEDNGCIYLGLISDFSGPFQTFGGPITEGQQAFWQRVNEEGGIGGLFDVALPDDLVADGQYNPQVTAEVYQRLETEVAALGQTLGTPQTQAIIPSLRDDSMISATLTWWSGWEFEDVIVESGSNYCIDAMNGIDWIVNEDDSIQTVIHVGFAGDYGGDARAGLNVAAEAHGLDVVAEIDQTPIVAGGDVAGAVNTIVTESPDLVLLTVGPQEMAEIVGGAAQNGYQGRFLGNHPVFLPDVMESAAAPAIQAMLTVIGPHEAWNGDSAGHQALRETYQAVFGGLPANDGATFGWVAEYPIKAALEKAVENGDVTREGIFATVGDLSVDYEGMLPTAQFGGEPNDTVQRQTSIGAPDPEVELAFSTVEAAYTGPTAEGYDLSEPCVTLG